MPRRDPHSILEEAVKDLYDGNMPGDLPRRWERFSDVAIMPHGSFEGDGWSPDGRLWEAVAGALGAKRLARMGEVSGEFRESGVEMLLGEDDWVVRRESGVDYGYAMTRCMFSAGNVNERRRMGEVAAEEEVVVDLYAGIGYYTLPALVHGGATVHACEWNPEAVKALRWGLDANGVEDRCTIHEGDNRNATESLAGVADRVFLGLLPSSQDGLEVALSVLSPSGGTLHVHGLAPSKDHGPWVEGVSECASALRPDSDLSHDLTRVKSYAPHWDHVVLDLRVA
jgi:tRNA wybutosine-synthesizing protein 3